MVENLNTGLNNDVQSSNYGAPQSMRFKKLPSRRLVRFSLIFTLILSIVVLSFTKYLQVVGHIEEGKKKGPPPTTVATTIVSATKWRPSLSLVATISASQGALLSAETAGVVSQINIPASLIKTRGDKGNLSTAGGASDINSTEMIDVSGKNVADTSQRSNSPTTLANQHVVNRSEEKIGVVEAGTLLVELDTTVERAELTAAEARSWEAKKALDRIAYLAPRQASSRSELDQAEATFKARRAETAAIEAKIARKQIRAPFKGEVGIRLVNVGDFVSPGTPVVPLYQLDTVYADFAIPQDRVSLVRIGKEVTISMNEESSPVTSGVISAIDPQVDPLSRLLSIRASFENIEGENGERKLRPGMFGTVRIPLDNEIQVVPVPETAISFAPYGNSVFVVKGDSVSSDSTVELEQRFVTLGERRGDLIAVISGLNDGERIVSASTFRLRQGMSVFVDDSIQPTKNISPNPPRT